MDLLGSILGSMEKPPTIDVKQRKQVKEQKEKIEKMKKEEKKKLQTFREKIQVRINDFIKSNLQKNKFEPMEKVFRAIVHEVADVAGLCTFSFGQEEMDRYVMVWKKEFAPCDEELMAYRRGEEWDPEKRKEEEKEKKLELIEDSKRQQELKKMAPSSNYHEKYEHLIGKDSAIDAAKETTANKSYGFVSSENKKDKRTIEEVMAQNRAKRKQQDQASESTEQPYKSSKTV